MSEEEMVHKLRIEIESDELAEICKELVIISLKHEGDNHTFLRILQLFLNGEWEK